MGRIPTGRGAVAAGHEVTARAAVDVLRAGGNAFDGAVAAMAAACVTEPVLASPGGGGFLMALGADDAHPTLIDFFGQTPLRQRALEEIEFESVFADFGVTRQEFHVGQGASATPGFAAGVAAIHRRYCSLPLDALLAPAIAAARDGIATSRFQAQLAQVVAPILTYCAGARAQFAPDGELAREGETVRNPGLGDFFERFAGEGESLCVTGEAAQALLAGQAAGGHLTADDLTGYRLETRRPLEIAFAGATVFLNPPPSAGGAMVAAMLHAMAREDLGIAGAMALADEARLAHGGDPVAVLAALGLLPDGGAPPAGPPAPRGTTHISVLDGHGNAAALTMTNGEGNGHMVGRFGYMPNNLLGEADLMPAGFHRWAANVRLASMMSPTVVRRGDGEVIALGSGGSNRIRSAIFQVLVRLLADRLAPEAAVAAGRLHIEDGRVDFEDVDEWVDTRALATGFRTASGWRERSLFFGGAHVALRDGDGRFAGAGDPRRAGVFMEA